MTKSRRGLFALACAALAWSAPGLAQGTQVFPPVPGPFVVTPSMPVMPVAPAAAMQAMPSPSPEANFAPPANAMRLPYWMQPGASGPALAPAEQGAERAAAATAPAAPPNAAAAGQTATVGYGQATAPGAFPGYTAQPPWAGQAQGFSGAAPQGFAQVPQGYGYGMPPAWAAQPYTPGPGWGGWAQPTGGAGN